MLKLPEKVKHFINDSFWTILGLVLMNVAVQFAVYPLLRRYLSGEAYGNILYMISYINILSISVGVAVNYARMAESAEFETHNGDYHLLILGCFVLFLPVIGILCGIGLIHTTPVEFLLYYLLMCVTAWRYYADVEFRLSLNYKGYFLYYACISAGYLFGVLLFVATGVWILALLTGEIFGCIFVLWKGQILRHGFFRRSARFSANAKVILIMLSTELVSSLVSNGDRLILKNVLGGVAVTIFYLASLMGKTMSFITTPLNTVIIGHLAKYKGRLNYRLMGIVTALVLGASVCMTGVCLLASHILISVLYPEDFLAAKPYFLAANLAQIFHFTANSVTVVLLRFAKKRYQLDVNIVYALAFFGLAIPCSYWFGLWGFTLSSVIASSIRLLHCLGLGYYHVFRYETPARPQKNA